MRSFSALKRSRFEENINNNKMRWSLSVLFSSNFCTSTQLDYILIHNDFMIHKVNIPMLLLQTLLLQRNFSVNKENVKQCLSAKKLVDLFE